MVWEGFRVVYHGSQSLLLDSVNWSCPAAAGLAKQSDMMDFVQSDVGKAQTWAKLVRAQPRR